MKRSYIFYRSFYEAIQDLDDATRLAMYDAISSYALTGEKPRLAGTAASMFKLVAPQVEANWRKYENSLKRGKTGDRAAGGAEQTGSKRVANAKQTGSKRVANENDTVNGNVNVNANHNAMGGGSGRGFLPPGPEEVRAYASQMGYALVDADEFCDYYEANGWMVGSAPMKNWKAAAAGWQRRREKQESGSRQGSAQKHVREYVRREYTAQEEARRSEAALLEMSGGEAPRPYRCPVRGRISGPESQRKELRMAAAVCGPGKRPGAGEAPRPYRCPVRGRISGPESQRKGLRMAAAVRSGAGEAPQPYRCPVRGRISGPGCQRKGLRMAAVCGPGEAGGCPGGGHGCGAGRNMPVCAVLGRKERGA